MDRIFSRAGFASNTKTRQGRWLWFSSVALAGLLSACSKPEPTPEPPKPVRVITAHYESVVSTARYSGEIKVRHEPALSFQEGGKLLKRLVDVGTVVRKGQLLATLDPPDFKINQAGSAAQLQAAQAELAKARKDLLHIGNLLHQNLASPAHYARREDAVHAAEARVAEAKAALDLSSRKSNYSELYAEHAGVITAVEAEAGQVVTAGQAIYRLARTDEKEVVINVPENRLDDLRSASAIKVSLWAKPGVFYAGRLREISPGADALIRTFTVKVSVPEANEEVRMGMTATVHVQHLEPRPVAWLPLTAVTQQGGQPAVWVLDPSSHTVHPQVVSLGVFEDQNAKILDGIKNGDRVVTAGVHKLLAGQKVRLLEEGAP